MAKAAQTTVTFNRRRAFGFGAFFGTLTVAGSARAVAAHSTVGLVIVLAVLGIPTAVAAFAAARRRVALVIDEQSLIEGRSRRTVPWASVASIRVGTQRGLFGDAHHLVLTLADGERAASARRFITTNADNPNEVDINLDWLSIPWNDAVAIVEQGFGHRVIRRTERPFRSARR